MEEVAHGIRVIHVGGEVDLRNSAALRRILDSELMPGSRVALDLLAVEFFGCSAITVLTDISEETTDSDARWIVAASPAVSQMIAVMSVNHGPGVRCAPTMDEALAALCDPSPRVLR